MDEDEKTPTHNQSLKDLAIVEVERANGGLLDPKARELVKQWLDKFFVMGFEDGQYSSSAIAEQKDVNQAALIRELRALILKHERVRRRTNPYIQVPKEGHDE